MEVGDGNPMIRHGMDQCQPKSADFMISHEELAANVDEDVPFTNSMVESLYSPNITDEYFQMEGTSTENGWPDILGVTHCSQALVENTTKPADGELNIEITGHLLASLSEGILEPTNQMDQQMGTHVLSTRTEGTQMWDNQLTEGEKHQLDELLRGYQDLFARSKEDFGSTSAVKHKINTRSSQPIKQRPRQFKNI